MRFQRRATRCLLRGAVAGLREIHIFRRERQRLPVEPAFEQQRTPRVERAGEIFFELFLQPRELFVGQMRAVGRRGFGIGVAVEHQIGAERFDKADAVVERIGPRQQIVQRMIDRLRLPLVNQPGDSGGGLTVGLKTVDGDLFGIFGRYHFAIHVKGKNSLLSKHFIEKLRDDSQKRRAFFIIPLDDETVFRVETVFLSILPYVRITRFRFRNPEILHDFWVFIL